MTAKICINCGAPLTGNKCEYCGTEYGSQDFTSDLNAYSGKNTVSGQAFRCYIRQIDTSRCTLLDLQDCRWNFDSEAGCDEA